MRTRAPVTAALVSAITWFVMLVAPGPAADKDDPCEWGDKTAPKAVTGTYGNNQQDFHFSHLSDVDKDANGLNHYVRILKNKHPTNLLPASWEKAGIKFERIGVAGCGYNDFKTSAAYAEETKTVIKFGTTGEKEKDDAPLYVKKADAKAENPRMELTSRLYANLVLKDDKRVVVDLRFVSKADLKTRQFTYQITNRGSKQVLFRIPSLTKVWGEIKDAKVTMEWKKLEKPVSYLADISDGQPATFSVIAPEAYPLAKEQVLTLDVLGEQGEVVASGYVSLYVLEKK